MGALQRQHSVSVEPVQALRRQGVGTVSAEKGAVTVEQEKAIAEAGRQIDVMQTHDDGITVFLGYAGELVQYTYLVMGIEFVHRLVQQPDSGSLYPSAGHAKASAFSSRQAMYRLLFMVREFHAKKRFPSHGIVSGILPLQRPKVGMSSGNRFFEYRARKRVMVVLWQKAKDPCELLAGIGADRAIQHLDISGGRGLEPGKGLQQGCFPATVAAEQGPDFAWQ